MMEPASLALSIAALYTTCRDCYSFFTTVKSAEEEASSHLRELEIQQSILKAWGFHWEIHHDDRGDPEHSSDTRRKRTKLHKYLVSNRFKAEGVFSTLSALADTLSNQEKLIKRYGIQLQPVKTIQDGSQSTSNVQLTISNATIEDLKPVINEVKNRLSVLNKFKWALKDRDNFKKLIVDLRSHSESLYRLCPENAFESMNIYLTMECLARQESPAGLKWTSRLATQQAQIDGSSSVREGYELLASAATLKASVNENRGGERAEHGTLPSVAEEQPQIWYLGKSLALFEEEVVYVEMRDYRGPPIDFTPEQKQQIKRRKQKARRRGYSYQLDSSDETEDDVGPIERARPADAKCRALIKNFVNTFQGASMRESVYGLDIAGMIDHTDGEYKGHCSILYKLPGSIGMQTRERPAENLKLRAPVTLRSILETKETRGIRSTLGARFELARKLVRAVCLLHSSGWLHKNIRAESVMFFPDHVTASQEDRYETKTEIDVSKPILMGYIFSRPDDIGTRVTPPPVGTSEEHGHRSNKHIVPGMLPDALEPTTMTAVQEEPYRHESSNTIIWEDRMDRPAKPRGPSIYGLNMAGGVTAPEQSKETNISGFTLDYYQHPAKHADPRRLFRHAYDVYSLGVLLLEVGLWEKLQDHDQKGQHGHNNYVPMRYSYNHRGYEDATLAYNETTEHGEEDHYERRRRICRKYLDRLRWSCGDTYADVVLSCLMIDSSDDEVAKASERELCARIVADLEGCQA